MRSIFIFVLACLFACQNEPNRDITDQTADTVVHIHRWDSIAPETVFIKENKPPEPGTKIPTKPDAPEPAIRTGKHNFTLHWISWDHPGTVILQKRKDGKYTVKGEQKSRDGVDYVRIDGVLTLVTPLELKFDGTIESRVRTINQGGICLRQGSHYTFRSTQNRKYWRLQQMDNCEGGGLVDYIDIYF